MSKLLSILFFSFGFGAILNVPEDWSTIQAGIDAAQENDTVLVAPGDEYMENLIIEKTITLASRALFDDLSEGWVYEDDDDVWHVDNDNIANTIINGFSADTPQSVILINSPPNTGCIEPVIFGFTIKDGSGTIILVEIETPEGMEIAEQLVGGGILINNALPEIHNNFIKDCNCPDRGCTIESGGAIQQTTDVDFPAFMHLQTADFRCEGDVDYSDNMFYNNEASYGSTLASDDFNGYIDLTESYFDVYADEAEDVSDYWVDVDGNGEYDASNSEGNEEALTQDAWVSPSGDDANSGLSPEDAFLTIGRAFQMIYPTEENPVTINLTAGTFSPDSTSETFPINMLSNVNLIGQGEEITIIDAEQTDRVILINWQINIIISDLTITGGYAYDNSNYNYYEACGAGIYIINYHSGSSWNPDDGTITYYSGWGFELNNLIIRDNHTNTAGGGICIEGWYEVTMDNCEIFSNSAYYGGGLLTNSRDIVKINNSIIFNNVAEKGGGIGSFSDSKSIIYSENLIISDNTAEKGGGIYLGANSILSKNTIIKNNTAFMGGGIYFEGIASVSYINITNLFIYANSAEFGGGIYWGEPSSFYEGVNFTHLTISDNEASEGGGIYLNSSFGSHLPKQSILNSIIVDNGMESIFIESGEIDISYSNIEGDTLWEGEGNLNLSPLFIDQNNNDYSLAEDSPCVDSGNPNPIFNDLDGTRSDLGATGGNYIKVDHVEHDFGELVFEEQKSARVDLYNIDLNNAIIDSITSSSDNLMIHLESDMEFPIIIEPYSYQDLHVIYFPEIIEGINSDTLFIYGDEIQSGSYIVFKSHVPNVLRGNISGILEKDTYRIYEDIIVPVGEELIIEPGAQFVFHLYEYGNSCYSNADFTPNFIINGTLIAEGTLADSILFISSPCLAFGGDCCFIEMNSFMGLTINDETNNTYLKYINIRGARSPIVINNSSPHITDIKVKHASYRGSGIYINNSNAIISNATINPGGIIMENSEPSIINSLIFNGNGMNTSGNPFAPALAGGIIIIDSGPKLINNVITDNQKTGIYLDNSNPTIINTIIWNNEDGSMDMINNSIPTVSFSDIEGDTLWYGVGNINTDPLFTSISENGIPTLENEDYSLLSDSYCIDTGTADTDGDGEDDIVDYCGSAPDMGAFEYCEEDCGAALGDVNGDSEINILDLVQIANLIIEISTPAYECAADYNGDGQVNILDLVQIANYIIDN